jgi:ribose transport system substrate-binding protein
LECEVVAPASRPLSASACSIELPELSFAWLLVYNPVGKSFLSKSGGAIGQGSCRRSQQLQDYGQGGDGSGHRSETLDWIKKGGIAATIAQKPYTMAFVGMQMLDNLYHHKPPSIETDWSKDSFAPIPTFVDTGSALIDKSNVDLFLQAKQSATGGQK